MRTLSVDRSLPRGYTAQGTAGARPAARRSGHNAAEDEHGFISLDAGLSVIAEHAKSPGYDGLILFMDELILWLATLIHNQKFVARDASKITNFVEGGDARRAIPVVSFIARRRDLRGHHHAIR